MLSTVQTDDGPTDNLIDQIMKLPARAASRWTPMVYHRQDGDGRRMGGDGRLKGQPSATETPKRFKPPLLSYFS